MEDKIKSLLKNIKMNESMLSMVLGVVTIFIVGLLVFNFYKQTGSEQISDLGESTTVDVNELVGEVPVVTGDDGERYPASLSEKYTVVSGDHLWKIAEDNYGSGYNWVDIAKANDITTVGVVHVGQELMLPKVSVKVVDVDQVTTMTKHEADDVINGSEYTVVTGDNLWSISVRAYQDGYKWSEVAMANNLVDANLIETGQVLSLPR